MKKIKCNFCGNEYELGKQILFRGDASSELYICETCINACGMALKMNEKEKKAQSNENIQFMESILPSKMKEFFDDYIINQDEAKKILAVTLYNHAKRVLYNKEIAKDKMDMKLKKSNVLMIGPSGSGKTLFIETIAKRLNIPYAIQDATSLTEAGYVGDDVETCLKKLINNAEGDIKKAETGIIFLDEIDKIGRKGENVSITRDVSGEGVQQALLKMLDGSVMTVPVNGNRKHPQQECHTIDTSNILFICGGAFEGIEKIIEKRITIKRNIGFSNNNESNNKNNTYNDLIHLVNQKDLRKFGMMPELIGRLPIICTLEELDKKALVDILTKPVDSIIRQYKTLFEMDGIELEFTNDCLESIADKAMASGVGARALRGTIEKFMMNYMYSIPDNDSINKVILTKECVENGDEPYLEYA